MLFLAQFDRRSISDNYTNASGSAADRFLRADTKLHMFANLGFFGRPQTQEASHIATLSHLVKQGKTTVDFDTRESCVTSAEPFSIAIHAARGRRPIAPPPRAAT